MTDWINVAILLYGKTLKESMIDKKIDEKEGEKLRSIYNHYINKQDETKKSTQFKFEEVFGNVIPEDTISPEQITKLNTFLTKKCECKF